MPYPSVHLLAILMLGSTGIRGFQSVTLRYPMVSPTPPSGALVTSYAMHRGLAPAWLEHIPKYVCDHAQVTVDLSEPSEFGPRWFSVRVTNYSGGGAEGTCLVDTRRGPKVVRYVLVPSDAQGTQK